MHSSRSISNLVQMLQAGQMVARHGPWMKECLSMHFACHLGDLYPSAWDTVQNLGTICEEKRPKRNDTLNTYQRNST